jgi:aconitate hydratase
MGSVEASLAGPKRPQDRVALGDVPKAFAASGELEVNHRSVSVSRSTIR